MTLKAAYFALGGLADTDALTWAGHFQPAIARGVALGIAWPAQGAGHNVRAWAELLVVVRALSPATAYPPPFAREVQGRGRLIGQLWRETLRYHKNFAYLYEVTQAQGAAGWLLNNSRVL
jgi:hypothetical protein